MIIYAHLLPLLRRQAKRKISMVSLSLLTPKKRSTRSNTNISELACPNLVSTPLFITHDTRDNILDSKKGHIFELETAPYFYMDSKERPFFKTQISATVNIFHGQERTTAGISAQGGNRNYTGNKITNTRNREILCWRQ